MNSIHPETKKVERGDSLTPPLNPLPQGEGRYTLSPLPIYRERGSKGVRRVIFEVDFESRNIE